MRNLGLLLAGICVSAACQPGWAQETRSNRVDGLQVTNAKLEKTLQLPSPRLQLENVQSLGSVLHELGKHLAENPTPPRYSGPTARSLT